MSSWQNENLHAVLECKTPTEVFQLLQNETRRLGMQSVSWVIKLPIPLLDQRVIIFNTYPKEWERRYFANNYIAIDPTVKHGMNSVLPMLWSDEIMNEAPDFWEDARSFGLGVGIAQSVYDRQGSCSMLSLSRDSMEFTQTELAEKAPKFSWLSQLIHTGMTRLIFPKEIPETAANLTAREKEVLKLVAAGMTSQVIADRLNLSKRTADFHIEEATTKLGAENRTDAAVKAIVLGLT
jgi:LuxR family quorum-sensing system transcriptional regulator SolR